MPENLPPVLRWEYNRTDDPEVAMSRPDPAELAAGWETKEIEVERDAARQALQDIETEIAERSEDYLIDEVVVGVEKYIDADVYCRCAHGVPMETVVGVEVTAVPGDVIAARIPARERIEEHLFEEDDAES